jgi:hypothetical protein
VLIYVGAVMGFMVYAIMLLMSAIARSHRFSVAGAGGGRRFVSRFAHGLWRGCPSRRPRLPARVRYPALLAEF